MNEPKPTIAFLCVECKQMNARVYSMIKCYDIRIFNWKAFQLGCSFANDIIFVVYFRAHSALFSVQYQRIYGFVCILYKITKYHFHMHTIPQYVHLIHTETLKCRLLFRNVWGQEGVFDRPSQNTLREYRVYIVCLRYRNIYP